MALFFHLASLTLFFLTACDGPINVPVQPVSLASTTVDTSPQAPAELLDNNSFIRANEHYKIAYPDAPQDLVAFRGVRVYRPNHGLAHGGRKAALAKDAIALLKESDGEMAHWINHFTSPNTDDYNPNFNQQLSYAMLMLRTGRSSEKNDKYLEDCAKSAEIFAREAKETSYFPKQKDIDDISFAIRSIGDDSLCFKKNSDGTETHTAERGCSDHRLNIRSFLYGVHHLDLRRMIGFDKTRILKSIANMLYLMKANGEADVDNFIVKTLWARSGEYLALTGDRDMDAPPPNNRLYKVAFFQLSPNPALLRERLMALQQTITKYLSAKPNETTPTAQPVISQPPAASTSEALTLADIMKKPRPPYSVPSFKIMNITDKTNIWYNYRDRPQVAGQPGKILPWAYRINGQPPKGLFKLVDVVPDRLMDGGRRYVKLYHGTTTDYLDNFMSASALRFDVGKGALGTGFYLTASVNEAMHYACERLKAVKDNKPTAQGMVLAFGVEENPVIRGKYLPNVDLSNPQTGEPLDPEIFFKRNGRLFNQFNFFKNAEPYIKLFGAVILPDGFAISSSFSDGDGKLKDNPTTMATESFRCDKNAPLKQ